MNFKVMALNKLVAWILGGELFDFIRKQVATASDLDISGEQKRQLVFNDVKAFAGNVATVLLNIGIEVAVAYFKAKQGELK